MAGAVRAVRAEDGAGIRAEVAQRLVRLQLDRWSGGGCGERRCREGAAAWHRR